MVVGVDDGTGYVEFGIGDRGRSRGCGRYRSTVLLVLVSSTGVECCVGIHNLLSRGRSGLSRSRAAVMDGVNCNTSRDALGNGDEGWAFKYTLLLINSE